VGREMKSRMKKRENVSNVGDMRKEYKTLVGKPEGKTPGRPTCR
jgi:hypothetical protein